MAKRRRRELPRAAKHPDSQVQYHYLFCLLSGQSPADRLLLCSSWIQSSNAGYILSTAGTPQTCFSIVSSQGQGQERRYSRERRDKSTAWPRDLNPEGPHPFLPGLLFRDPSCLSIFTLLERRLTDLGSLRDPTSGVSCRKGPPTRAKDKGCLHSGYIQTADWLVGCMWWCMPACCMMLLVMIQGQ